MDAELLYGVIEIDGTGSDCKRTQKIHHPLRKGRTKVSSKVSDSIHFERQYMPQEIGKAKLKEKFNSSNCYGKVRIKAIPISC